MTSSTKNNGTALARPRKHKEDDQEEQSQKVVEFHKVTQNDHGAEKPDYDMQVNYDNT